MPIVGPLIPIRARRDPAVVRSEGTPRTVDPMSAREPRIDGRSLRYQGRREELLKAVTRYVLDHGVGDLAIRPVAEAVGVSHVTLLNHFGTKEQMITEVVDRLRAQTFPAGIADSIPEGVTIDGAEVLGAWWDQWLRPEYEPALRLTFEVYGKALLQPEAYATFREHIIKDWMELLEGFIRAAGCPERELEPTASVLLAVMRGLQMDLLASGERERVDAARELFLGVVRDRQARWVAER
jgi:AcrR family transcriptional regulator